MSRERPVLFCDLRAVLWRGHSHHSESACRWIYNTSFLLARLDCLCAKLYSRVLSWKNSIMQHLPAWQTALERMRKRNFSPHVRFSQVRINVETSSFLSSEAAAALKTTMTTAASSGWETRKLGHNVKERFQARLQAGFISVKEEKSSLPECSPRQRQQCKCWVCNSFFKVIWSTAYRISTHSVISIAVGFLFCDICVVCSQPEALLNEGVGLSSSFFWKTIWELFTWSDTKTVQRKRNAERSSLPTLWVEHYFFYRNKFCFVIS